jgi:polyisoprenoid-binding protein YceI
MRPSWETLAAGLLLAATWLPVPAHAQDHYAIDQRFGAIEFTVDHLGLFSSHGEFRHFSGSLAVDFANPPRSGVDVDIDAGSITMPWQEALEMLRSPNYFDVQDYPRIKFHSTQVVPVDANHFEIHGLLMIRGVTQPETLDAALIDRRPGPQGKTDVADFVVTGKLKRSAFGMTADHVFVSDTVNIRISARIALVDPTHAD